MRRQRRRRSINLCTFGAPPGPQKLRKRHSFSLSPALARCRRPFLPAVFGLTSFRIRLCFFFVFLFFFSALLPTPFHFYSTFVCSDSAFLLELPYTYVAHEQGFMYPGETPSNQVN